MFIRYTGFLCLNDWNDVIEIKHDHISDSFIVTLELKHDEIIYKRNDFIKGIPIQSTDSIAINVEQEGRRIGDTIDGYLYLKKPDDLLLIFSSNIFEEFAEIEKLKTYEMYCYLAKRISQYYNIPWEFIGDGSVPEESSSRKIIKVLRIVIVVCILVRLILQILHK